LRAGGALAVVVVLYFWSPAHWVTGSVRQHTSGANSPAINGNGNVVTIGGCSTAINGGGNHVDCVDPRATARFDERFDRLEDRLQNLEVSVANVGPLKDRNLSSLSEASVANPFSTTAALTEMPPVLSPSALSITSIDWAKIILAPSLSTLSLPGRQVAIADPGKGLSGLTASTEPAKALLPSALSLSGLTASTEPAKAISPPALSPSGLSMPNTELVKALSPPADGLKTISAPARAGDPIVHKRLIAVDESAPQAAIH
jgi:hypothetical protein